MIALVIISIILVISIYLIVYIKSHCKHDWDIVERTDTNQMYYRCNKCGKTKEYK